MSSLFDIGLSGLAAAQRGLDVTSHNIANANTEGYTRQRAEFTSRRPEYTGYGYVGTGVDVAGVRRIYDGFLDSQVRGYSASSSELETFHSYAVQIDNILADPDAGLNGALQRFTNAMQDLANDPTSTAARQTVLGEGEALAAQLNSLDGWLRGIGAQVNTAIQGSVNEINQMAAEIARLNDEIIHSPGIANGDMPNDLLDQRDQLLQQLSQKVSIDTIAQDDGSVNVMVGKGQALVVGVEVTPLTTYTGNGVDRPVMVALDNGSNGMVPITGQLSGGELGGLLGFRERMLDPTIGDLGRIALGVGQFINQQHRAGFDLNGAAGGDFFNLGGLQWDAIGGTTGSITLTLDDAANLTGAEYELGYDGIAWSLTRTDTGQAVTMTGSGTAADPFVADGMRIEVPVSPAAGDGFLLQPTRTAAGDIGLAISDPARIAASQNGAVGDNANALAMARVFDEKLFAGGTESINQAYQRLVGETGTATRRAEVASAAQNNLLDHAVARREELSGVNLDEEAANLIRFQQAYQAAAQVIAVADQMFQTLLNATGR